MATGVASTNCKRSVYLHSYTCITKHLDHAGYQTPRARYHFLRWFTRYNRPAFDSHGITVYPYRSDICQLTSRELSFRSSFVPCERGVVRAPFSSPALACAPQIAGYLRVTFVQSFQLPSSFSSNTTSQSNNYLYRRPLRPCLSMLTLRAGSTVLRYAHPPWIDA